MLLLLLLLLLVDEGDYRCVFNVHSDSQTMYYGETAGASAAYVEAKSTLCLLFISLCVCHVLPYLCVCLLPLPCVDISVPMCLSAFLYLRLSISTSVCCYLCASVSFCLSISSSVYLFIRMSLSVCNICVFLCLHIFASAYLCLYRPRV